MRATLVIRLSDEQLQMIKRHVDPSGLSLSAWARMILLRELRQMEEGKK